MITSNFDYGIDRYKDEVYVGCFPCDFTTPCGSGNDFEDGVTVKSQPHKGNLRVPMELWQRHLNIVQTAAVTARSARFEHGAML